MDPLRDGHGYLPIADYGVLGDGRTAALVGRDGRIDWWAIPTLDSPPVCAALLDPQGGGHLTVEPVEPARSEQSYLDRTNILETVHRTATGTVRVVDSLNTGSAGRLPWTELARRVEGVEGRVELRWAFVPGHRLLRCQPWVTVRDGVPIVHAEDQLFAVVTEGTGETDIGPRSVGGRFSVEEGGEALIGIVSCDHEPLPVPSPKAISERIERTAAGWRRWSDMVRPEGEFADAVARSALALKLVLTENTGAIAAAATTSLPESVGGPKNYDYRYSWVRDSSFALDALIQLRLDEEVHGAVSWLLDALRRNGGKLHIFYTLGGERADQCAEIDLPGWRCSRPVRSGNTAAGQLQLGVYGDLLDTMFRYVERGHVLDQGTARLLADLADDCCNQWMLEDSGIWELDEHHHYTISKIGCWTALDRAARLAAWGQLPDDHRSRWESTAAEVHQWVTDHCWSETRQAYTFYAGTDELDAAVLLAGRTGFDRGPRLASTVDAVRSELGRGPLVYRYSGMEKEEGAFVACSFWLVEALGRCGRTGEARKLMRELVGLTSACGLLSEQMDPASGQFLGNIPQALSHLALINAAFALERAHGED